MAKIEMDISEYEALKENKRLLEQSLEREKEHQTRINQLLEEKNKVLEESKMKVVKITRVERTEHALRKVSNHGDPHYTLRQVCYLLGVPTSSIRYPVDTISTDKLMEAFFSKATSETIPQETITLHGLDEIQAEIRKSLGEEYKQELIQSNKSKKVISELEAELVLVKQEVGRQVYQKASLLATGERVQESLNRETTRVDNIRKLLSEDITWYNWRKIINKIREETNADI